MNGEPIHLTRQELAELHREVVRVAPLFAAATLNPHQPQHLQYMGRPIIIREEPHADPDRPN